jgi:polar amino acid transport system substrate-binding protein
MNILLLLVFNLWIFTIPRSEAREVLAAGSEFHGIFEVAGKDKFTGLGPDLLRAVAERMGDHVRFIEYPWARAQKKVELGQFDILIGPYRSPEREGRFLFAKTPFYQDRMLLFHVARDLTWSGDYAAFSSKKIGYILGWAYGSTFEKAMPSFHAVRVADIDEGLDKLLKGQIDLLASNRRTVKKWLGTRKVQPEIHAIEPPIAIQQGYFAFPKKLKYESYRQRFDEAFHEIVMNGTLEQLARKYDVETPSHHATKNLQQ